MTAMRLFGIKKHFILVGCLFASAVFSVPSANAQSPSRPPSGIAALDSLPVHDWGVPDHPISLPLALGLSALFPGGGQFYGGHPVRGSFLLGMETLLFGLSLYTFQVDLPHRNREIGRNLDSVDAAAIQWAQNPDDAEARARLDVWTREARRNASLQAQYRDLATSQLAWAVGLHFYGMADAVDIALRSRRPVPPPRSVGRAFVYGLLIPGGGQIYNDSYGKFGMLYMAHGASAVSAWSRQNVVRALNVSLATARAEAGEGYSANVSDLEQDRTLYRRKRNQYFWGMAVLHVYSIMDGMVDAALSDFDSPNRYAIGPGYEPFSFVATVTF
jgi:TM2 domain-containing membrane protein YozV